MTGSSLHALFQIDDMPDAGPSGTVRARVQAGHPILQGHFPGRPVVPGVCLVDLVLRVSSALLGAEHRIIRARSIKFLMPVEPATAPELVVHASVVRAEGSVKAEARIMAGETVAMKLTAELAPVN
jgi:3-hydroxyacyl-[acyl-carrier-protein] dehydratase